MNLRASAEDAGWSIREAVWGAQERLLWRGSDASRAALQRAGRATAPLQRLIQTKFTWPLSDAYRARGRKARAALATTAATLVVAAGAAGAIKASDHASTGQPPVSPVSPVAAVPQASDTLVLQGVQPQFQSGQTPAPPPAPAAKPTEKPAEVAWDFAQAFVAYEVGHSKGSAESAFAATATKQLAKALQSDPPRLPAGGKVPKARVLNVVLGTADKKQVTASVSLVRLRAVSELRLTLTRTGDRWRVAQVLG
ncbi:MAG TPA: hypothetical protein VGF04_03180 [Solirubrobacterales bacterium]|jgi:hypothetical protein